jgi:hypothetical protein
MQLLLEKTQQEVSLQFFSVNLPHLVFNFALDPIYDSQKAEAPVGMGASNPSISILFIKTCINKITPKI